MEEGIIRIWEEGGNLFSAVGLDEFRRLETVGWEIWSEKILRLRLTAFGFCLREDYEIGWEIWIWEPFFLFLMKSRPSFSGVYL